MPEPALLHLTHPPAKGEGPHPALLLLHGRGADERDLLPLAKRLDPRLFVVTARAPFNFPLIGYKWYDLGERGVGFPTNESLLASIDRLRSLLSEMVERYPIDPERLYVGGFSMGAATAGTLALLEPERVAGAAILSGYLPIHNDLPFKPAAAAGHPFFVAHGIGDPTIPIRFGRETRDFLTETPVALTYREYSGGHEIGPRELFDLVSWLTDALDASSARANP